MSSGEQCSQFSCLTVSVLDSFGKSDGCFVSTSFLLLLFLTIHSHDTFIYACSDCKELATHSSYMIGLHSTTKRV